MLIYTVYNDLSKYSIRIPVKHRKTAICSRHRTVTSQDFVSTALLRYGVQPYSAVYGTVVSPKLHCLNKFLKDLNSSFTHHAAAMSESPLISTLLLYVCIWSFSMRMTFRHNVQPGHYSRMCFHPLEIYTMSFQSFLTLYNPY